MQDKAKFPLLLGEIVYLLSLPIFVLGVYMPPSIAADSFAFFLFGNIFLFAYFLIPAIAAYYMKRGALLEEKSNHFNKKAEICAVVLSCIYMLAFPFFCSMGLIGPLAFGSSKATVLYAACIVLLLYSMPVSLSISVYLMWARSKQLSFFFFSAALPIAVFFLILLV